MERKAILLESNPHAREGWDIYSFDLYETAQDHKKYFLWKAKYKIKRTINTRCKNAIKGTTNRFNTQWIVMGKYIARAIDHDQIVLVK